MGIVHSIYKRYLNKKNGFVITTYNNDDTIEDYTRLLLENFKDRRSSEVYYCIKNVKKFILDIFPEYSIFIIRLSPIHKTDKWINLDKNAKGVYIVIGLFYKEKKFSIKSLKSKDKGLPFIFDRILLHINNNIISRIEIKELNQYIDKKRILS